MMGFNHPVVFRRRLLNFVLNPQSVLFGEFRSFQPVGAVQFLGGLSAGSRRLAVKGVMDRAQVLLERLREDVTVDGLGISAE